MEEDGDDTAVTATTVGSGESSVGSVGEQERPGNEFNRSIERYRWTYDDDFGNWVADEGLKPLPDMLKVVQDVHPSTPEEGLLMEMELVVQFTLGDNFTSSDHNGEPHTSKVQWSSEHLEYNEIVD
jgi:hypothetical protein